MPPIIDHESCQCCGTCFDICPQDVFGFVPDTVPTVAYADECWTCGACVIDCPVDAVRLRLPLQMRIVPSPANYDPVAESDSELLRRAADFSRSVTEP